MIRRDDKPILDLTQDEQPSAEPRERDPDMEMMRQRDFNPRSITDPAEAERLLHIAEQHDLEISVQIKAAKNIAPLVGEASEDDIEWMRRASYAAEHSRRLCAKLATQHKVLLVDQKEQRANRIRLMFIEAARAYLTPEKFDELMVRARALAEEKQSNDH